MVIAIGILEIREVGSISSEGRIASTGAKYSVLRQLPRNGNGLHESRDLVKFFQTVSPAIFCESKLRVVEVEKKITNAKLFVATRVRNKR